MSNSGVISGIVKGEQSVGAVVGKLFSLADISSVYSRPSVQVLGRLRVGGLIGWGYFSSPTNTTIQNSYSQAYVKGDSNAGGLFGNLYFDSQDNILSLIRMYTISQVINTTTDISTVCNVIGTADGPTARKKFPFEFNYQFVYYDITVNPSLPNAVPPSGLSSNGSPEGFESSDLTTNINQNYDQCNIWDGINLRSQYEYVPGTLPPGCPTPTNVPSTTPPSTTPPSTTPPSTTPPSTTPPSTNPPSTTTPSTNPPSTTTLSTIVPSTTNSPSTILPSTTSSTTATSTTLVSSNNPSNQASSSFPPSTSFPSNSTCFYNVLNCEKCGNNSIKVDLTQFEVSCAFVANKWVYAFKNKTSDFFYVTQNIEINNLNGETIYIDGNFDQLPGTVISFVLKILPIVSLKRDVNDPSLLVNGCVSLNGDIEIVLDERPISDGDVSYNLISYNCSQQIKLSDSQVKLKTNYKDSQCDSISQKISNQQNTLSVSISSTLNKNCGGKISIKKFIFGC